MILIKYLSDRLFINKNVLMLSRKKYDFVELSCQERLKKYPPHYASLYILALCGYYKKNLEISYDYYKQLTTYHKVKNNIHKWFIKNLIVFQLHNRNLNDLALNRCYDLLPIVKNNKIEIELLKYICVALFRLKQFDKVLKTCKELKIRGFKDKKF